MKHIFILNSQTQKYKYIFKIREKLSRMNNFEHLVFDTEYPQHEKVLTARMCDIFKDEDIRFYCFGDKETLGNIISSVPDISLAEFAVIPSAPNDDLLRHFDDPHKSFFNIDSLINGKIEYIDYIDFGSVRVVNSMFSSIGAIAPDFSFTPDYNLSLIIDRFLKKFPNNLANIIYILMQSPNDYEITIDGKNYNGRYSFILFQNGKYFHNNLQISDKKSLISGVANITLIKETSLFNLFKCYKYIKHGEYDKISKYGQIFQGKSFDIQSPDNSKIHFVFDDVKYDFASIHGEVKHKKLKLVVPKSVNLIKE